MNKHNDDTTYSQWLDGLYVMLDDMECDYEKALVEDSLRRSVYFVSCRYFLSLRGEETLLGVNGMNGGLWHRKLRIPLTRAQALYIATGETTCTTS